MTEEEFNIPGYCLVEWMSCFLPLPDNNVPSNKPCDGDVFTCIQDNIQWKKLAFSLERMQKYEQLMFSLSKDMMTIPLTSSLSCDKEVYCDWIKEWTEKPLVTLSLGFPFLPLHCPTGSLFSLLYNLEHRGFQRLQPLSHLHLMFPSCPTLTILEPSIFYHTSEHVSYSSLVRKVRPPSSLPFALGKFWLAHQDPAPMYHLCEVLFTPLHNLI